jgi:hypothetical protein
MRQLYLRDNEKILIELEYAAATFLVDRSRSYVRLYLDGFNLETQSYHSDCSNIGKSEGGVPASLNYVPVAETGVVNSLPFIPGTRGQYQAFKLHVRKGGRDFWKDVPGQEVSGRLLFSPCKAEEIPAFLSQKMQHAIELARLCDEGLRELHGVVDKKVQEDNEHEEFFQSLMNNLAALCDGVTHHA